MARRRQKIDGNPANQISLFDLIEEISPEKFSQPDFQIETKPLGLRIKEAISEAISDSDLKRYDIAGRMSEYLGTEITDSMLNSWTAESKEGYRMPAEYFPIFCKITQNYKPLEVLAAAAGARLAKSDEIYFMEMGKLQQIEESSRKRRAQLVKEWKASRVVR
jgi:hypothetical protein